MIRIYSLYYCGLHMPQQKAKRQLTPEAFGRFLRWLSEDDGTAVEAYQSIRGRLVGYFSRKGCTDPHALFDETIDIVIGKLEAGEEILSPLAYCYGVAKNVWRQDHRKRTPVPIDRELRAPEPQDTRASEQELECLERCVSRLSPVDRVVITRYHRSRGGEKIATRKLLAEDFGGMNALRVKVCRIRKGLRLCVVDCIKQSATGKLG